MYYSSIGILAILILFITHFSILFRSPNSSLDPAHKAYKNFLNKSSLISKGLSLCSELRKSILQEAFA